MVDFGGWDMPVQYSGIIEEHNTVRNAVGLFDVSHMGEIEVRGPEALNLIDYVATNNASKLKTGQAHYSGLLYDHGGFVDDILVHKVDDDHFFICVNASNQEKDFDHINLMNLRQSDGRVRQRPLCADRGAGPESAANSAEADAHAARDDQLLLVPATAKWTEHSGAHRANRLYGRGWVRDLRRSRTSRARSGTNCSMRARSSESSRAVWVRETRCGSKRRWRCTAMRSAPTITPLEADLGWIVKFEKPDFMGRAALEKQKAEGVKRKLAGFEMRGRGIGRDGYEVLGGRERLRVG